MALEKRRETFPGFDLDAHKPCRFCLSQEAVPPALQEVVFLQTAACKKGERATCRPQRPQRPVCEVIFIKSHFSKAVPLAFILWDVDLEKLSTGWGVGYESISWLGSERSG